MKKVLLLAILLGGLLIAGPTLAAEYYVDAASGNDSNAGSSTAPWYSLTHAFGSVASGDTLYLKGNFQWSLHFVDTLVIGTENLTVSNWGDSTANLDYMPTKATLDVQANGVTVNGLSFVESITAVSSEVGSTAINLNDGNTGLTATNNTFTTGAYGVYLNDNSSNVVLNDNIATGGYLAVFYINGADEVNVFDNDLAVPLVGTSTFHTVYVSDSSNVNLKRNKIYDNETAAAILIDGNSSDVLVSNNLIYNNSDISSGVYLNETSNVKIFNNTFYNNDTGVAAYSNTNSGLKVRNNIFSGNKYGVTVYSNTSGTFNNNMYHDYTCLAMVTNESAGSVSCITKVKDWRTEISGAKKSFKGSPKFVDKSTGNLNIKVASDAIDRGATLKKVKKDYDKVSRPYGPYYDVGAYEYPKSFRPKKVLNVKAPGAGLASTQAKITWKKRKTASKGYVIRLMTKKGKKIEVLKTKKRTKTSKVIEGLEPGKTYKVKVRAKRNRNDVVYTGKWSKIKSFTTLTE